MSRHYKHITVANTLGVAQAADGRWFSLSQEAFSNGTVMWDTREEAQAEDDRHHAFMLEHHSAAVGIAPYVKRMEQAS
jgi:hypothetical protein